MLEQHCRITQINWQNKVDFVGCVDTYGSLNDAVSISVLNGRIAN